MFIQYHAFVGRRRKVEEGARREEEGMILLFIIIIRFVRQVRRDFYFDLVIFVVDMLWLKEYLINATF